MVQKFKKVQVFKDKRNAEAEARRIKRAGYNYRIKTYAPRGRGATYTVSRSTTDSKIKVPNNPYKRFKTRR